ncbi:MAG: elongation factor G, partial [Candidatus Wallbacteria bacterium]|nr:elongation factor G [Candidatus Wallbacteria bacterium]
MKVYKSSQIRNICLVGNGGTGKTSLLEAVLFDLGANSRLGRTDDGTSVCDYQPEEVKRKMSLLAKVVSLESGNLKFNFIDTPGFDDFQAEVKRSVPAAENIMLVVDPGTGIVGHTEKVWRFAEETPNCRSIFINKLDKERIDFSAALSLVQETFGKAALPVFLPVGKEADFKGVVNLITGKAHVYSGDTVTVQDIPADMASLVSGFKEKLVEAAAESDETLMEKFFEQGTLSDEEFIRGLKASYADRKFFPVFCGSAIKNIGVRELLATAETLFADPSTMPAWKGLSPGTETAVERRPLETDPISLFVFKTQSEQHTGELVFFKVVSGVFKVGCDLLNTVTDNSERINQVLTFRGREKVDLPELYPGDLGVTMKLKGTFTGHTLSDAKQAVVFPRIVFPSPVLSIAIVPKSKVDQEKCSGALAKIAEEDPTFRMSFLAEFSQMVIHGMGESHLNSIIEKLRSRYNVQVDVEKPRIPYRETIKKKTKCEKKYKKQSGGRGQYGHCVLEIAPLTLEENYKFEEKIFGGSIPGKFIPSIEKGVKEAMEKGVLAGCPVMGVSVTVLDGSYHDVDSSDMAFKIAGSMA